MIDFAQVLVDKINERIKDHSYDHLALYRQKKMIQTQRDTVISAAQSAGCRYATET